VNSHGTATRGRVAVVGGGVSGLAAAFRLHRDGFAVELLEASDALGGRCAPGFLGDRSITYGGKNIGRRYTSFRAFTAAFGDHPYEPFGINSSRVEDGRLLTLDSGRRATSLRSLMRLGRRRDLARLIALAVRVHRDERNRFLGGPAFTRLARRSDHQPLSAHFGEQLTRTFLRPVTVRMNGAEPGEVNLGTFGTNLGMLMDTFDQLSRGLQPVLDDFAHRVPVRLGTRVERLLADDDGRVAGVVTPVGAELYDGVVLAAPAHAAAELVEEHDPPLAERLRAVRYFPAAVVIAEYARPVFPPEVRALVFGEGPCSNAGAYGFQDLDLVRYTFSGRDARALLAAGPSVERLLEAGESQLKAVLGFDASARIRAGMRRWDDAYCAYVPFHGGFLDDVHDGLARLSGLELAGDYLRGASIEACFRAGEEAARRFASHIADTRVRRTPAGMEPAL
jgi:protoporphyrinogen/coproporphyrinogen III oxidase